MLGKASQRRVFSSRLNYRGLPMAPSLQPFLGAPRALSYLHPNAPPPTVDTPQPAHPGWAVLSAQLTRMGREGSRQATWITVLLPCLECTGKQGEPHLSTHD